MPRKATTKAAAATKATVEETVKTTPVKAEETGKKAPVKKTTTKKTTTTARKTTAKKAVKAVTKKVNLQFAGKDIANPIGTILSAAMMLKYSFNMSKESDEIEKAVSNVLDKGYRCGDIMSHDDNQELKLVGCSEMGKLIVDEIISK